MYEKIKVTIEGIAPIILHNAQLSDPINPIVRNMKKLTGKRIKTDADYKAIADLEWQGSLYVTEKGRVIIPGVNIEGMLVVAAKKVKLGKLFTAGLLCDGDWELEYEGPKKVESLIKDNNFRIVTSVVVQRARIMRTRPVFKVWSLSFELSYLPDVLNPEQIKTALITGGQIIGLCDWRPKYGRFELVSFGVE